MSGSVNKVILIGNLGQDPEIRTMNNGGKVSSFSLATSEHWKDRESGEKRTATEWHKVVIFNDRLVTVAEQYLKKGSKVYIEGQLQTRKWTDASGVEKYTTEVVLKQFRGEITMLGSNESAETRQDPYSKADYKQASGASSLSKELDDDLPF